MKLFCLISPLQSPRFIYLFFSPRCDNKLRRYSTPIIVGFDYQTVRDSAEEVLTIQKTEKLQRRNGKM